MTLKLDKLTKAQIMTEVRNAVRECLEGTSEVWVSGDELGKQYQMFSSSWLKRYGETLPRTQAIVEDSTGRHRSGWYYPRNRIGRMIQEGSIRHLAINEDMSDN